MNRFGTRNMQQLIDRIRVEVIALQEADEQENGLVGVLTDAADTLDAAQIYHGAVESALA